jgi:hypothetical protein
MHTPFAIVVTLIAMLTVVPAQADPYRWCGIHGGGSAAITNCYFVTLEQCRASMSGNGGWCVPNQFYDGRGIHAPADPTMRRRRGHG